MTDKEFIDSLRPEQKTYTVFERPYWNEQGNWNAVSLKSWLDIIKGWFGVKDIFN